MIIPCIVVVTIGDAYTLRIPLTNNAVNVNFVGRENIEIVSTHLTVALVDHMRLAHPAVPASILSELSDIQIPGTNV